MTKKVNVDSQNLLNDCSSHAQVYEGDGTPVVVVGFKRSYLKTVAVVIGYLLSLGILRIVFHWFPHWMLWCTHSVCLLSEAQRVLIQDSSGVYFPHKVKVSILDGSRELLVNYQQCNEKDDTLTPPSYDKDSHFLVYFIHKRLKYVWKYDTRKFELLRGWEERTYGELFPTKPLSEEMIAYNRVLYGTNEIAIRLTPIVKMLLSECLNPFYCFQAFSCALWLAQDYWTYALCIVVISIISLITQVYEVRRNERALKKTVCGSAMVTVCREVNGVPEYQQVDSTELVPGDILEIPRNGCVMHCDALVLSGNCIVNESTLTGESVPVTKTPIPQRRQKDELFSIRALARHVLFGGTLVIQTRNYADERVLAVVARTGFRTAKGELVRSILFPKPLKFKFTQDALKFVAVLACVAVVGFGFSVYFMHRSGVEFGLLIVRALDLITIAVPPALPMAMTIGIVFAQRRLRSQDIYCINPGVINVCGVINVTCFDKTGTLTEDGLDLWGVVGVNQGRFEEPCFEPSELDRGPLLESMATCHSLTRIEGVLSGDPLDLKMFQSTKWEFIEEVDEDHCKFDMAVPAVVRPTPASSCIADTQDLASSTQKIPYEVGILRQFPFTSTLQRMSVIVRLLDSSHFNVYTKGAPETLELLCRRDTVPSDFHSILLEYTRAGYRVLALAWRPLKISCTRVMKINRERVEQDLLFLGLLVMENRLKPETGPVIEVLRNANIRPIMVTGDNMLTALSVARDCGIIEEFDRIVIVSAKPPPPPPQSDNTLTSTAAGDLRNGVASEAGKFLSGVGTGANRPLQTSTSTSFYGTPWDHDTTSLVQFHYAEDLHKPVTEVTTTTSSVAGPRVRKPIKRESTGILSAMRPDTSSERRWFKFFTGRSPKPMGSYGAIPVVVHDTLKSSSHANGQATQDSRFAIEQSVSVKVEPSLTSHRVNIRMIDRPDFHLAISGKMWAVIREHYPWLIPKLVVKGTVFARFSPDQKAQLIESLQSVGYFVAMCGDGANDCGALKAAHAGVSLSEAEASVASPFTAKQQNISCIPTLIREGRCALVTSFGTLKFMIGYSLVQFFSVVLLYYIGSKVSNGEFLYIDLFLITTISITFGYTKAYTHLSVEPPSMHVLSAVTLMSLGSQLAIHVTVQVIAFISIRLQPWYIPLFKVHKNYELANFEGTAVFIVSVYQYLILAIVFAKGAPYRRSIVSNYLFITNLVVSTACTIYLTVYPCQWLLHMLEMVRIPSVVFLVLLHSAVLANFLLCYMVELIIDGVSFRRRLLHIRRALFPRHVDTKDYEKIREELDKLAGSWPPLIRSASVHALPRELFNEMDAPIPTTIRTSRSRKRNVSGMSSDSDDDDPLMSELNVSANDAAFRSSMIEPVEALTTPLIHSDMIQAVSVDIPESPDPEPEPSCGLRRRHTLDLGDLSIRDQLPSRFVDASPDDISTENNHSTPPSRLLQMPEAMLRLSSRARLNGETRGGPKLAGTRRRFLSSGFWSTTPEGLDTKPGI